MIKEEEDILIEDKKTEKRQIIIYNDDVNTFENVIQSLVEVCNHDYIQAEQCATQIHFNGKCDVKSGDFETLKPYHEELIRRKLSSKIE